MTVASSSPAAAAATPFKMAVTKLWSPNPIDHADDQHDDGTGHTHGDQSGGCAHPAFQAVAQQNRHVGGIQAWKTLADRQEFYKFLVVNPMILGDQVLSQVRNYSAETGSSDEEELEKHVKHRDLGAGRGYK